MPAPPPSIEPSSLADQAPARTKAAVAAIVFALILAAVAIGVRQQAPAPSGLEGQRVQPVTIARLGLHPTPAVEQIEVGGSRHKPVLLHFWGPSCAPCVQEAPQIDAIARDADSQGYEVWTVSAEETTEIRELMLRKGWQFQVLHDVALLAHAQFRVSAIPVSVVLDGEGVVLRHWIGPQPEQDLRDALAAAMLRPHEHAP